MMTTIPQPQIINEICQISSSCNTESVINAYYEKSLNQIAEPIVLQSRPPEWLCNRKPHLPPCVPEPNIWLMACLGLFFILRRKRKVKY